MCGQRGLVIGAQLANRSLKGEKEKRREKAEGTRKTDRDEYEKVDKECVNGMKSERRNWSKGTLCDEQKRTRRRVDISMQIARGFQLQTNIQIPS